MFKIYMSELFYVKFCMLSFHLWIIIRPKEYPGVLPIIMQRKLFGEVASHMPIYVNQGSHYCKNLHQIAVYH